MLSILRTEPATEEVAVGPTIHFEDAQPAEPSEPAEFEIVLGRSQLASVLFVATVVIAVFSSLAYLAGKSIKPAPRTIEVVRTELAPGAEILPMAADLITDPTPDPVAPAKNEPSLFANPKPGPLYLQMGAVEKGIAVIFVEGLRKHGFEAFVAPGPNENIFRVLIGPLADEHAFLKAKDATSAIGLGTFARRYPQ
jgi:hypothetical protein